MRQFITLLALLCSLSCKAQTTPEGLWMSFDDDGKTPSALVRITKLNGHLVGRIEKVLDPQADATCSKCIDERKNQPLVGMEIIRDAKAELRNGKWEQGRILDPDDGTEYKLVLELQNAGQTLLVRGYWGVFWRTQQWRKQGP
jgi:uncharacterized protein (DUF2147 family)